MPPPPPLPCGIIPQRKGKKIHPIRRVVCWVEEKKNVSSIRAVGGNQAQSVSTTTSMSIPSLLLSLDHLHSHLHSLLPLPFILLTHAKRQTHLILLSLHRHTIRSRAIRPNVNAIIRTITHTPGIGIRRAQCMSVRIPSSNRSTIHAIVSLERIMLVAEVVVLDALPKTPLNRMLVLLLFLPLHPRHRLNTNNPPPPHHPPPSHPHPLRYLALVVVVVVVGNEGSNLKEDPHRPHHRCRCRCHFSFPFHYDRPSPLLWSRYVPFSYFVETSLRKMVVLALNPLLCI